MNYCMLLLWFALRGVGLASLVLVVACGTSVDGESGVRSVEAKIDGLTCPACAGPLTASLRRHFDKAAALEVDDKTDTATVRFDESQDFSEEAFRAAVTGARMRVLELRLHACGRVEATGEERWLVAGRDRFLLQSADDMPLNVAVCLDGNLDSTQDPAALEVLAFELQPVPAPARS